MRTTWTIWSYFCVWLKKHAVQAQHLPIVSDCQGVIDEEEGTLAITAMERARHHLGKAWQYDSIVEVFAQVRYSMAEIVLRHNYTKWW